MDIAALIAWVITALGGFVLLARWINRGGLRQQQTRTTHFPAPVVFGHFLLAAAGLVVWIIYLAADRSALAWTSFGILVAVALLGFTLFARWLPVYRTTPPGAPGQTAPAERHLPVPVVAAHGLFGATSLVLVLLAALGVGGS
ncbi:hypothetical protein AQI88_30790 [Streptomyces cellostaticus]|uniref:DUF2269 domain-containing protein n=1 Tax=Streptomyces cellostaticus TaxID=67285 RepID=A0A101NGK3_9ACTN|nr:hypothetical protein [Streptomyces cellostaticus]KUM92566.1 hypothetical protein AQI88_30790 [Streptomyces cellostaticus]GHI10448.1 hypothetical protein Scel_87690 [Streptomyces cellostaticus]